MPFLKFKYYLILSLLLVIEICAKAQPEKLPPADTLVLYEIAYIEISGNDKTREKIVKRELSFKKGEQYILSELKDLIDESYKNLIKLSLFNYVTINTEIMRYQRIKIEVILEERWFVWPQLSIINNDRNFNTWWKTRDFSRLDYRLAVEQNNVFGLNHTLKFEISYGYTRDFSIGYRNISLGAQQKHFIDLHCKYYKQASVFYRSYNDKAESFYSDNNEVIVGKGALINYSFRPRHKSTHSWELSYHDIKIADTLLQVRPDFLSENKAKNVFFQFAYTYIVDNRDNSSFPLTGNRFKVSMVKRGLGINKKYPVNLLYFYTNFRQFYKINKRLYAAHSLSIKKSLQTKTPYYYKRGLGYADYLRGFEYYVVEAEDLIIMKNTLNFELLPRIITNLNFIPIKKFKKIHYSIYLNTFFDIGYGRERDASVIENNRLINSLLYSGGIGINLVTYYDKVLRVEYSLNSLGEAGVFVHFKASI